MTRLKELVKSILIFFLILSALYLSVRVWVYDPSVLPARAYEKYGGLLSFLGIEPPSSGPGIVEKNPARELVEAARPVRCAITITDVPERCGAEYDKTQVDMIHAKTIDFVGKAIGSASDPEEITMKEWQSALRRTGIYYDYLGRIPLSAIALWQNYERPAQMDAIVRRLALAVEGDTAVLYYVNELDGKYYRCLTAVETEPLLEQIGTYRPNDCYFAFEVKDLSPKPMPELFVFGATPILRMASSRPVGDEDRVFDTLCGVFDIRAGSRRSPKNLGDLFLAVEGSRSLTLSSEGEAVYSDNIDDVAGGIAVYMPYREPSEAEIIESVRAFAEKTAGAFGGEAELFLREFSHDKANRRYTLSFMYVLNGVPVLLSDSTHAAVFRIEDGILTYARVVLREFVLENESCVPMPLETAIKLEKAGTDFRLSYLEAPGEEGGLMSIGWFR